MRILLWTTGFPPNIGGVEVCVHNMVLTLNALGHQVLVIENTVREEFRKYKGIDVHGLPYRQAIVAFDLKTIKKLIMETENIIEDFSPDIIHIHCLHEECAFFQARLLRLFPEILAVLTIHGLIEQSTYATSNCQELLSRIQSLTFVSNFLQAEASIKLPNLTMPTAVIHNGIIPVQFNKCETSNAVFDILVVSRFSSEKGIENAIKAMKLLRTENLAVVLHLIGDGDEKANYLKLIQELDLQAVVNFIGVVASENIIEHMSHADVILVPSLYESFGLVAAEAGYAEKPVIASNIGGLTEVVSDGETGILVEPNNPAEIAAAVKKLMAEPELAKSMGLKARARVEQYFSIENITEKYLKLYAKSQELELWAAGN